MQNNIVKSNQHIEELLENLCECATVDDIQSLLMEMLGHYSFNEGTATGKSQLEISNKVYLVQCLNRSVRRLKAQLLIEKDHYLSLSKLVELIDVDFFEETLFAGLNHWIYSDEGAFRIGLEEFLKVVLLFYSVDQFIVECFKIYSDNKG